MSASAPDNPAGRRIMDRPDWTVWDAVRARIAPNASDGDLAVLAVQWLHDHLTDDSTIMLRQDEYAAHVLGTAERCVSMFAGEEVVIVRDGETGEIVFRRTGQPLADLKQLI